MWHSMDSCASQQWRECNRGFSIGLKMFQNIEAQNCIQHWAYLGYAGSYTREIDVSNHPLMYRLKAENRESRIAVSGENIRVQMIHWRQLLIMSSSTMDVIKTWKPDHHKPFAGKQETVTIIWVSIWGFCSSYVPHTTTRGRTNPTRSCCSTNHDGGEQPKISSSQPWELLSNSCINIVH